MIAKMKFLKLTGPINELDRIVEQYVSRYNIQIENAVAELKDVSNLMSHAEYNPYKDLLMKANDYASMMSGETAIDRITLEQADKIINDFGTELNELTRSKTAVLEQLDHQKGLLRDIIPYSQIHYDVQSILHFKFVKYRFGKITKEYYKKLADFMQKEMCSIFCKCESDAEYVWGVYFVPASEAKQVDAIYSSMHFERFYLSDEYEGLVDEAKLQLEHDIAELERELIELEDNEMQLKSKYTERVLNARECIDLASKNHDIRKQVAYTKSMSNEFFILCGWMLDEDAKKLEKDIANDNKVYIILEDNHVGPFGGAPIKLKNPKILKPFEMLIKMYGLPSYDEFDPTLFVALSYTILFGMMFGDVGQGMCLAIGGIILYRIKKIDLAAIISLAGVFSAIFGFLFGSVFGYEDIIKPLWLRPTESMSNIPFIGKMNTIFAAAILLGMCLILLMMIFNIINGFRSKHGEEVVFDHNGICGFIFYGAVVFCIMLFMTGNVLPGGIVIGIMFGLPLILIMLKEPLMAVIFRHSEKMPKEKGIFVVQAFFEMFEVLLSYFSNTLSFVRIGGFAVSHASMMAVVMMLAGAENGGSGNVIVVIIGNIFVCGLEGLIVGIQAMRLEYYEMFSRFYNGGGREFKPYNKVENNK